MVWATVRSEIADMEALSCSFMCFRMVQYASLSFAVLCDQDIVYIQLQLDETSCKSLFLFYFSFLAKLILSTPRSQ